MKNILSLLLILVLSLSLCGCGGSKDEEKPVQNDTGSWAQKNADPSDEEKAVFQKAVEGSEYADYSLRKTLATQVVAGLNYRFECSAPDGSTKILTVYRDLEENCTITHVE